MNWKIATAFATVSFFGVGSLAYLFLHKDEENEEDLSHKRLKTTVVEVKIPKELVGSIIGKGGSTIKEIETKSDTIIKIIDDIISPDFKICLVRGTSECAQYAECLIHEIILNQPRVETFEMYVPSFACGRIIGKRGDNIRMIHRNSKAKLFLESGVMSSEINERKLVIKGTAEQIALAKTLVELKLDEEKIFRSIVENTVPKRPPRSKRKHLPLAKGEQKQADSCRKKKKSIGNENNDILEVYLSAIESPDRFWLQKVGPWSEDLNRLVDEMTDYYSEEENKQLHKLENLKLGQVVAVPISYCGKWFRAEILDIQINSDESEPEVLLHNVDFGDTEKCKKGDVYELKHDFLKLTFQAIECTLAKVKPRDSTWSKEAINHLKGLKHFGVWHSITARILTYKERPRGTKKEMSLIPCVELYDSHGYEVSNVAEVFVERGLAVWEEEDIEKEEKDEKQEEEEEKEEEEEEEKVKSSVENLMSDSALKEILAEASRPLLGCCNSVTPVDVSDD